MSLIGLENGFQLHVCGDVAAMLDDMDALQNRLLHQLQYGSSQIISPELIKHEYEVIVKTIELASAKVQVTRWFDKHQANYLYYFKLVDMLKAVKQCSS